MAKTGEPDFTSDLKQAQKDSVAQAFRENASADGLADIGIDAIAAAETLLNRFYAQTPLKQPLACAAGCTFCCHQYVGLSTPELAILTKYVQSNFTSVQVTDLIKRLNEVVSTTTGMSQFERAASKIDCPLLDPVLRQCTVYAARPLTCRGMHSLDREACEAADVTPGKNHPIPQYEAHKGIIQAIAIGLQLGLAENDINPKELELSSALLHTLTAPQAIDHWLKDGTTFKNAEAPKK